MKRKDRNLSPTAEKNIKALVLSAQDMKQGQLGHLNWTRSRDKYIKVEDVPKHAPSTWRNRGSIARTLSQPEKMHLQQSQHDSFRSHASTGFPSQNFERSLSWTSNRIPSQSSGRPPSQNSDSSSFRPSDRSPSRNSDRSSFRSDRSPTRQSDRSSFRPDRSPSQASNRSPSRQSDRSSFQSSDSSSSRHPDSFPSQASSRSTSRSSDSWAFDRSLSNNSEKTPSWTYDRSSCQAFNKSHPKTSELSPSVSSEQLLTRQTNTSDKDFYLTTSKTCEKPDLLNFKKGWMSLLDGQREWKKRWFVLTDSSLRYYRDSNAEEADDLDGEIDLRSCADVTEFAVQRNYGFQIHTKEAVFTLSAMTSGIRRNWIEALRKNVRPTSAPDVTKLSDNNKENSFRSYSSQKVLVRSEDQRLAPGSEVITWNANKKLDAPSQRQTPFSYVELAPLQQGPLNQENSQRPRAVLRTADSSSKADELEREQSLRSEEKRKWFEGPVTGGTKQDEAWGDLRKVGDRASVNPALSVEQKQKLNEEIEKKWLELERLPLRESKQIPLTALLVQGKGSVRNASGESREIFEKEIQALKVQLESAQQELDSYRGHNGRVHEQMKSHKDAHVPRGYISQEACERSLVEMESSHQQAMMELQRHHQRELERLRQEKEELLAEETAATAAAIEAMKKAHKEELHWELEKARSFPYGKSSNSSQEALRQQHRSDVESLKRDLQALSERYSHKCLEINALTQTAEERDRMLLRCQQEGRELLRQNQELNSRLSEEIEKLRAFMAKHHAGGDVTQNSDRSSYELEVLLRVKENELQYLKQEVGCLREELQTMQNDKQYASSKYKDIYVELNNIKTRSEREIEQLKEHLRLAMAALQEEATMHNSIE